MARPALAQASAIGGSTEWVNVKKLGASGDGATLDTRALQKAIDACGQNGGGTVYFPPGRYLSGTIVLRSRITLHFDPGAILMGSTKLEDYPPRVASVRSYTDNYTERSLIFGEHLERVTLQGQGVIDGQGGAFKGPYKVRPFLLRFVECQAIAVRDLTLRDSPMWVQHYLACDGVFIQGITVLSKCNANNDGIDIDACQRVRIANCDIQSGDDAIVLKSTLNRPCRNVAVTNCLLSSDCNAFKLGTESNGGFEDIVVDNCSMYDTRLAGIALEMVDGGALDRVNIANVTMNNVRGPIFIRLGNRARPFQEGMPKPGVGTLRNVNIGNIQASGADDIGCCIVGLPDNPIENVSFSHIRLACAGGRKSADAQRAVAEKAEAYPEYSMFGILPAYGWYCRHIRNLVFDNVAVSLARPDERPSLICEDVSRLRLAAWTAGPDLSNGPALWLKEVKEALVHGCRGSSKSGPFLRVSGKSSRAIEVQLAEAFEGGKAVEIDPEVQSGAVKIGTSK